MVPSLNFLAGGKAFEIIKDEGLNPDRIKVLVGASGGPKWLILSGIDRVLPGFFGSRTEPLYFVGSSIGGWRATALAQKDPLKAIALFQKNYIAQSYSKRPTPAEVTSESIKILNSFLDDGEVDYILNHPFMRINLIAVRSSFPGAFDNPLFLLPYMGVSGVMNFFSRQSLSLFYDRVLFYDRRNEEIFSDPPGFDTIRVPLSERNYKKAVLATGSIPLVMSGVRDIEGAPGGTYRDGGIINYHPDIPFPAGPDDLVLYPHFYSRIVPGWFDKNVPWRKPSAHNMDNVLLVSPTEDFVSSLPMRKIPDRKDFYIFKGRNSERTACWSEVAEKSNILGREFADSVNSGFLKKRVELMKIFT